MGVRQIASISQALIEAGCSTTTPAALVSRGTTPQQALLARTLGEFTDPEEDFTAYTPALFVIGEVIRLSEGRTSRPLAGKKVIVTRARHQASSLQEALESEGAEALLLPTIELSSNEANQRRSRHTPQSAGALRLDLLHLAQCRGVLLRSTAPSWT